MASVRPKTMLTIMAASTAGAMLLLLDEFAGVEDVLAGNGGADEMVA